MFKIKNILMLCIGLLVFASCSETEEEDTEYANWQERNDTYFTSIYTKAKQAVASGDTSWKIIRCYSKNDTTTKATDYIVVQVLNEGTGTETAAYTDSVKVHYRGNLIPSESYTDGYQFDSSWSGDYNLNTMAPSSFTPSGTVLGFCTALMKMHKDDRWKVYIPYNLGYGETAQTSIPAYSTLIFDITMEKIWRPRI